MPPEDARRALLERLRANWAEPWSRLCGDTQRPQSGASAETELHHQLAALEAGSAASFPYFVGNSDEVTWFTVAPSSDDLRLAIEDLRAWLIPSYAAESRVESGVGTEAGGLRPLIAAVSPGGYFVWKTRRDRVLAVGGRLGLIYDLLAKRPARATSFVPTLYELRQRFRAALVVGDRGGAEAAIEVITREALDSASNVAFMRVRLADHFGEHAYVAEWDSVRDLVNLRLPATVRVGLVRAFHVHYLADAERTGDFERAARTYTEKVDGLLGPVLDLCRAVDGPEIARCLAYRSRLGVVPPPRLAELRASPDEIVARVLAPPSAAPPIPEALPEGEFTALRAMEIAARRGDQRSVQEFGEVLLSSRWKELSEPERSRVAAAIAGSLQDRANARLSALLLARNGECPVMHSLPAQDWDAFFGACNERDWERAAPFLDREDRPAATSGGMAALRDSIERIESLLTEPDAASTIAARTLGLAAMTAVIEDCRNDVRFPRSDLADVYFRMLELLTAARAGSAQHEDVSLFLLLADAVLQVAPARGREIAALTDAWWLIRPSEALLPFALEVLSLLSFHGSARAEALALWVKAGDLVRTETLELGRGEHAAWSSVGLRLGVDCAAIQGYIGGFALRDRPDPLAVAGLRKVAIVSLRQKQAHEASRIIRARCGADVVLVDETDAGPQVRAARNADVILVVWSATTHAVFRGLDQVRERVAYVQGTGAESIVLTLERTVMHGVTSIPSSIVSPPIAHRPMPHRA
jgi:hypothetical protein